MAIGALGRLPFRLRLLAIVAAAWALGAVSGLHGTERSPYYLYATSLLLAIGLYGSTVGIDMAEAAAHKRIIFSAITVGVVVKSILIGGVLYLASRDPLFLVLGVAVAQIDPLSVATLMGDRRLSSRVKAILASWASFDDPVTVILVVYASAIATGTFGLGESVTQGHNLSGGLSSYGLDVMMNGLFAGATFVAWRALRNRPRVLAPVLGVLGAVAVWQFLMLGIAIAGLFVRPRWVEVLVPRITQWALLTAGVLLGLLLVNGVDVGYGVLLGSMAFVAQVVVGFALTKGLQRIDRVHLALAQQNGITAIILALRLETQYQGAVAVIAPAIVVTNVIHFGANWLVDRGSRSRDDKRLPARE